jgi:hypothetical protein
MGWPIVVVASGGVAVTNSTNGFALPVSISANGLGTAVTVVASGGLPVLADGGGAAGGGSGGGALVPPFGFRYRVDYDGKYITDPSGNYEVEPV